jgi:Arc/MetJ family transcription regulator
MSGSGPAPLPGPGRAKPNDGPQPGRWSRSGPVAAALSTRWSDAPAYTTGCTLSRVSRTNIDIDEELVQRVMRRFGLASKRAAVDFALRRLLGEPMTRAEMLAMQGVGWSGDLDRMRRPTLTERG